MNQDTVIIKVKNNKKNQPTMEKILLVVDLDGTLIYSDLLYEGLLILLRKNTHQNINYLLVLMIIELCLTQK